MKILLCLSLLISSLNAFAQTNQGNGDAEGYLKQYVKEMAKSNALNLLQTEYDDLAELEMLVAGLESYQKLKVIHSKEAIRLTQILKEGLESSTLQWVSGPMTSDDRGRRLLTLKPLKVSMRVMISSDWDQQSNEKKLENSILAFIMVSQSAEGETESTSDELKQMKKIVSLIEQK